MFAMSSYKEKGKRKREKVRTLREVCALKDLRSRLLLCLLPFAFFLSACRQDMQDQPKYIPYRASGFFRDGLSARPLVEGTVPRGFLRADREFYTGKKNKPAGAQSGTGVQNVPAAAGSPTALYPDDVETFPFPITAEAMNRGQQRYQIFCAACHGETGYGDGLIVRRGFRPPPSYHSDQMRQAPVGHYFDVVTNGWGAMPSYAAQIKPEDRWAIIAYIRALQLSQQRAGGNDSLSAVQSRQGSAVRESSGEPTKGHPK
jgi:mono/diheme cytochrome c family protein